MIRSALTLVLAANAQAKADPIDDYLKAEMARRHIPALVYGIVKNGQLVRSQALGLSDAEANRPAKLDDTFEIGSLTKQFTSMGVMILVEGGRLDLEDPISKYLPDIPAPWQAVKIRNLLYQNSGIPEYVLTPTLTLTDKFTREQFMQTMAKLPMDFQPGEAWSYSNTNYALLGWIVEAVTKEPYTTFIVENVLRPAGMTHTSFIDPAKPPENATLAKGYVNQKPAPKNAASIKSDGALLSTLADLVKWDEALSDLRLVSRKSYTAIWTRGKLNSGRVHPYGMGWNLSMPFTTPYMGHGGASAGFSAGISRFPQTRLTVIVLTNAYPLSAEPISKQIAELYEPAVAPPPFTPIADPDPARTERVKKAVEALSINWPDQTLLEPELYAPMKTARGKQSGAGPWRQVIFIDEFTLGGIKQQGPDIALTYQIKSLGKTYQAILLWTPNQKLAQATLYASPQQDK